MAVGHYCAVAIRTRAGARHTTLMVQATGGFDPRSAMVAAKEAATQLEEAGSSNDMSDITATMPGLPYACGSVIVNQGRLRVLYRMAGHLIVMVIMPVSANALASLDLLDRCLRICTYDFRTIELSTERFAKRMQEVYMAISMLLSRSGSLTAAKALVDGKQALDSILQAPAVKRPSQPGTTPPPQTAAPTDPADPAAAKGQASGFQARRRTLLGQAAQVPIQFGFPTDQVAALHPRPGFEPYPGAQRPSRAALPGTALHQLEVLPEQAVAAVNQETSPLDDLLGPPAPGKKDKKDDQGPKKGEDPFAFVEAALASDKKANEPTGPPPPPVPDKPLLRLVEAWKSEVRGGVVVRAGHVGEVSWLPDVSTTTLPVVGFALQYTPRPWQAQPAVTAIENALQATHGIPAIVQPGWPEGYVPVPEPSEEGGEGDLQGLTALVAPSRQLLNPVILRYHVPTAPTPVTQPVRVLLSTSIQPTREGRDTAVLLGVQLQITAELEPYVSGLEVKLHIPGLYELPSRCRPLGAQLDGGRRVLRWTLTAPTAPSTAGPGPASPAKLKPPASPTKAGGASAPPAAAAAAGTPAPAAAVEKKPAASTATSAVISIADVCREPQAFSAAFLVSGSVAACKGVLRTVMAEVEVRGVPGTTLSGALLRQHGFVGPTAAPALANCSWKASVTARMP